MILDDILAHKRREVAGRAAEMPLQFVRERITPRFDERSLSRALRRPDGRVALIAEIKRASPSAGLIREDFEPVKLARAYEAGGADALSVLTDRKFFQGQLVYLARARMSARLPCLRKDFVIDEYQVWEARMAEADAVLLIVAALAPDLLKRLLGVCREAELEALVEIHDEKDLEVAVEAGAPIIGINNRNLQTFKVDLAVTEKLAPRIPRDRLVVSESGIHAPGDVARVRGAGAHAVLVGESLMRQPDVEQAARQLMG